MSVLFFWQQDLGQQSLQTSPQNMYNLSLCYLFTTLFQCLIKFAVPAKKPPFRVRNAEADGEAWAAFPGRKEAALAEGSGAAGCFALLPSGWRGTVLPAPG